MVELSLLLISSITILVLYIISIKRRLARDDAERKQSEQREQTRNHVLELLARGATLARILASTRRWSISWTASN